jgi:tetratricopeptide (TPR) repeat protein
MEELDLGRTLLTQGHLETAQRVLISVCQSNEECIEAFRLLAILLNRKGDSARARTLFEYAELLEAQPGSSPSKSVNELTEMDTNKVPIPAPVDDSIPQLQTQNIEPTSKKNGSEDKLQESKIATSLSSTTLNNASTNSSATLPKSHSGVNPSGTSRENPRLSSADSNIVTPGPEVTAVTLKVEPINKQPLIAVPSASRDSMLGLPQSRDSMLSSAYPRRAPSSPELGKHPSRIRDTIVLVLAALAVATAGGIAAFSKFGQKKPSTVTTPLIELDQALSSGSLENLLRARDLARVSQATGEPNPDIWARVGLVNAVLARDYGVDANKEAEEALDRASSVLTPQKERDTLIAVARTLLALATGDRAKAKERSQSALSLTATESSPLALSFSLMAYARVLTLTGDLEGALRELDKAFSLTPSQGLIVVDWSAARLENGDPVSARRALSEFLIKHKENSRARLLLAEAERALGEPGFAKNIEIACQNDTKISRFIRSACAIATAQQARLAGDRKEAILRAKTGIEQADDAQALGQAALLLATLGEVDEAENLMVRARKNTESQAPSLEWPDVAIRLGRGESVSWAPFMAKPAGPERAYTAMRAVYARKGAAGLAAALKPLPPGLLDIDTDLRAISVLAREDSLTKSERSTLENQSDSGNPVAAYVLGVRLSQNKDLRGALRWLDKALMNHGDACQAAKLYQSILNSLKLGPANKTLLRTLLSHNTKCPINPIASSSSY